MHKFIHRIISAIDQCASSPRSYLWLAIGVFVFELINLLNGNYSKDFWEHCAVINELSSHPVHPGHPIITGMIPHAFFSPYAVFIGFIGYVSGLDPFILLTVAGAINLILLLLAIRYFVFSVLTVNQEKTAFYFLLFLIFAWGPTAWRYSSFYHITTLHYVLPYPSTFSFILTLFSIGFFMRQKNFASLKSIPVLLVCILFNAIVLITHPTTAIFLFVFLTVYAVTEYIKNRSFWLLPAFLSCLALPVLLAGIWPYFPFWDLLLVESKGSQFHDASMVFYRRLFVRLLPLWLGIPLIWQQLKSKRTDLLAWSFIALLFVYIYGFITGQYGYGRIIFFLAMMLQLIIAFWFTQNEIIRGSGKLTLSFVFLILMLLFPLFHLSMIGKNFIPGCNPQPHQELSVVKNFPHENRIVLSDLKTILYLPAYGAKVTASLYPPYWIHDNDQRKSDIEIYFGNQSDNTLRLAILKKYRVTHIVIDKNSTKISDEGKRYSYGISSLVYSGNYYDVLEINDPGDDSSVPQQ